MIFRVKIALFWGLNPKVERNYRGGIGNFEGEIDRVLGFGGVEGCGAVGGVAGGRLAERRV